MQESMIYINIRVIICEPILTLDIIQVLQPYSYYIINFCEFNIDLELELSSKYCDTENMFPQVYSTRKTIVQMHKYDLRTRDW